MTGGFGTDANAAPVLGTERERKLIVTGFVVPASARPVFSDHVLGLHRTTASGVLVRTC